MRISDWSSDVCSSDLPPPVLAAQREPEQDFAAAAHGERVGQRAFDDRGGQRLDMFGAPARQAAAMLAIKVEILVQRDEGEMPRGAQPEVIILDPEQPGVIAAERLGHARAIEEAGDRKSTRLNSSH